MDPRVQEHAAVIVEHSVALEPGDDVIVQAPPVAEDLVVALYERIGEIGARPYAIGAPTRAVRAYLRASDPAGFDLPAHAMAAMEAADAVILVRGDENTNEIGDVDPDTMAAYRTAQKPVGEERLGKRWVGTQYPAPANAQDAEMSTAAYETFVWNAVNRDWAEQRAFQEQLVEILDPASEVRIVSGDTTDVSMRVDGMVTANDAAELNLPGGEVYTAPVPDSVEGEVLFDKPVMVQGREVLNVHLVFEGGRVVEHSADKNEAVLAGVLDTDEGARRLGELGIGMNRDIDRFTYNMLFDEKMGDTVHLATGKSIDWTVGEDREGNDSATHQDMIVDMAEDSYIEVDGEVVQRDGTFVFEDGFDDGFEA